MEIKENKKIIQTEVNIDIIVEKEKYKIQWGYPCFCKFYQNCEPDHLKWWYDNIKSDWTIIDAGANVGIFSILFGKKCKQVYAFEPSNTIESLEKNLKANNVSNVEIIKKALSYKDEIKKDNIYHIWGNAPPLNQEFEFTSIDSFVKQRNITIDAIKIDVDSYDYEVLYGAKNVLSKQKPVITVEVSQHALMLRHADGQKIHNLMKSLNYKFVCILDHESHLFVPN